MAIRSENERTSATLTRELRCRAPEALQDSAPPSAETPPPARDGAAESERGQRSRKRGRSSAKLQGR
jgi:hypothetical protein